MRYTRIDCLRARFVAHYTRLMALPRPRRRGILRGWAPTVGRAALLMALGVPQAQAATIAVGGACTLKHAINATNTDLPVGACSAGNGADVLNLSGGAFIYTTADNAVDGANALPSITSDITLVGSGAVIGRLAAAPQSFRVLHVAAGANLVLRSTTVIGGVASGAGVGGAGGGVLNRGSLTVQNSLITGNSAAGDGGGVYAFSGTAHLINSTITGNMSNDDGGGIYATGTVDTPNTIVADNTAGGSGPDVFGTINADYSLIGSTSGATIVGANNQYGAPHLGPLQDNGGPTLTHALLTGSPALDTGSNALAAGLTDQRGTGYPRIFNTTVDIGAFEYSLSAMVGVSQPIPTLNHWVQVLMGGLLAGLGALRLRRRAPTRTRAKG